MPVRRAPAFEQSTSIGVRIRFSCSCPDYAIMCKHVAAAMYGVGARLDRTPELLFALRGVSPDELHSAALADFDAASTSARVLATDGLASRFGIELADAPEPARAANGPRVRKPKKAARPRVASSKKRVKK